MTDFLDRSELDVLFTHTYYQVTVMPAGDSVRLSMPGLRTEELAEELAQILRPCFPSRNVRVAWTAADPADNLDSFLDQNARMTDMIISVRSAASPGHELLSRLGYFGAYEGYAPQNERSLKRGAGGAA